MKSMPSSTRGLDDLAAISAAASVDGGSDGVAAVAAMREVILRGEAELTAEFEAMSARLTEMTTQEEVLTTRHAELQSLIEGTAAEIAANRTAAAEADVEQTRTANAAALSEFRSAFETATAESVAAGKAQVKAMLDEAAAEQTTRTTAAQAELDAQEVAAGEILDAMKTKEEQVMKLAEALGTGAQSAGWGSYADQQRKAANWL